MSESLTVSAATATETKTPDLAIKTTSDDIDLSPISQRLQGETGVLGLEVLGSVVDVGALAVNGLRRAIAERRLDQAKERDEKLKLSAAVHREAPTAIREHRGIDPKLRPVTLSQRRQKIRADRREAKSLNKKLENEYRLRRVWGEDLGTPGYEARVKAERMPRKMKRKALAANRGWSPKKTAHRFGWNESVASRKARRVTKSAEGRDLPGQHIRKRKERNEHRITRLNTEIPQLEAQQRRIQREHEERVRRNRQRRKELKDQTKETAKKTGRYVRDKSVEGARLGKEASKKTVEVAKSSTKKVAKFIGKQATRAVVKIGKEYVKSRLGSTRRTQPPNQPPTSHDDEDIPDAEIVEDEN